ncbi:hypothetical protein [Rubrivirga sp. IMCC43871]|uniref:hypothetical protein n=1 Tax=Rubrivirga sp. IMCC43871 TaxID=3391575 RepID=UPI00398FC4DF
MSPHVTVVGEADLAARLATPGAPGAARVVVVGGPVDDRPQRAADAVASGAHTFLLWPPAPTAGAAERLADHAEEAGVEVGVARPLGATAALAGIPAGWAARLVTLALVARPDGPLAEAGWATLLAGALDVCATLADARAVARMDAVAERDGQALRAVALAVRFENRAYAQATVRFSDHVADDEVALYAARPGSRVEARSLAGPLCVEAEGHAAPFARAPALVDGPATEATAFVAAIAAGRPAPYTLDHALATLRLAEQAQEKLR